MTRPRPSRGAAIGMTMLLLTTVAVPAAAGEDEGGSIDPGSYSVIPLVGSDPIDLLAPIGPFLAGRTQLMSEGLDIGQGQLVGLDPIAGLDRNADLSAQSPRTQAAGAGAPVPFRQPG
ncbi:MAG: hypothetical protein ACC726_16875, partial [Chloroflexota bacterium]